MTSTFSSLPRRPISYSESHIHLPKFQDARAKPLLLHESVSSASLTEISTPPRSDTGTSTSTGTGTDIQSKSMFIAAHLWAIRFSLHLVLISLFETIFFWQFVSKSEDAALTGLVSTYAGGVLAACRSLSPAQRVAVDDVFDLFINQTMVDTAGVFAAQTRATFNGVLLRNSWLYFGGLCTLFASLSAAAIALKRDIRWAHIVGENIALVSLLGLYEWMFFHTIIYQYEAISPAELDRMVVDEFQANC